MTVTITKPRQRELEDVRQARIDAIRDAAITRSRLGHAAQHRWLDDGRHEVTFNGQTFAADTLEAAIQAVTKTPEGQLPSGVSTSFACQLLQSPATPQQARLSPCFSRLSAVPPRRRRVGVSSLKEAGLSSGFFPFVLPVYPGK